MALNRLEIEIALLEAENARLRLLHRDRPAHRRGYRKFKPLVVFREILAMAGHNNGKADPRSGRQFRRQI